MKNNQKGFTLIEGLLMLLVVSVIGFGGYYVWQNQQDENNSDTILTQEQTSKAVSQPSNSDPYKGWKTYALHYEKLSFKYPSGWTVSKQDENGRDSVSIKSPGNFTVMIQNGVQAAGDRTYVGNWSTKFDNSLAYLSFVSGGTRLSPNTKVTSYALLTLQPEDTSAVPAGKNVKGCSGCNGTNGPEDSYMQISIGYEPTKEMSVQAAKLDSNYKNGKLIIESMRY